MAKILSLLVAIAIWFLIKEHLATTGTDSSSTTKRSILEVYPKAIPVKDGKER